MFKNIKSLIVALVAMLVMLAIPSWGQEICSEQGWLDDLDYLVKRLEISHPDLYRNVSEETFKNAVESLRRKIPALNDIDVVFEIYKMLALIRDGHTLVWINPDNVLFTEYLHFLPVVFYPFDDGLHITAIEREHENHVGRKILGIGSLPVDEVCKRVSTMISADNQWGELEQLTIYLRVVEVLRYFGATESENVVKIRLAAQGGGEETLELTASSLSAKPIMARFFDVFVAPDDSIATMNEGAEKARPLWLQGRSQNYWFQYLPETDSFYLQINVMRHKEDEDFNQFCERLFSALDQRQPARLIIDLRHNSGGNHIEWPLVRGLIRRPFIDNPGRLFLVTGRTTYSAAQHLTTQIERYTEATLVGEPTSGKPNHDGSGDRFTLPNSGIGIRTSIQYYQDSDPYDHRPMTKPHISIPLSSTDYAANRDPVLDFIQSSDPDAVRPDFMAVLQQAYEEKGYAELKRTFISLSERYPSYQRCLQESLLRISEWLYRDKKDMPGLMDLSQFIIKTYPDFFDAYYFIGLGMKEAGMSAMAMDYFRKCLELNPAHLEARRELALLELDSEK